MSDQTINNVSLQSCLFPGNAPPATVSCLPRITPASRSTWPRLMSPQVIKDNEGLSQIIHTDNSAQVVWLEPSRPTPSVEPSGGWENPMTASTGSPRRMEWSTRSSRFEEDESSHSLISSTSANKNGPLTKTYFSLQVQVLSVYRSGAVWNRRQ